MKLTFVSKLVFGALIVSAARVSADTVNFLGTVDNDLANPANWSAASWTSADTLLVSTANFTMPAGGLRVSADMPASAELKFGTMPNSNVTVDFGGYSLNTTTLSIGSMHDDANRNYYIKAIGGFTGVTNFSDVLMKGHIRFYDGVYTFKNKFDINNWYPYVYICSGAQVIIEDAKFDCGVQIQGNTSYGKFIVDGGRFTIQGRTGDNSNWQRAKWLGNASRSSDWQLLNGAVYEDQSIYPGDEFLSVNVLIKDSGYYVTNAIANARNTEFAYDGKKVITNSVFRTAQLYCGPYSPFGKGSNVNGYYLNNATVDFCDSEVTLALRPGTSSDLAVKAGIAVPDGTKNNTIRIRGEKNRFTTQQFVLGGVSNVVEVSGGTFAVSNKFDVLTGRAPKVSISNTVAYVKTMPVSAYATNSVITFARGARITGAGEYDIGGLNGTMRVEAGSSLDIGANHLKLKADHSTFTADDTVVTGCVSFAADNGRAVLSGGTYELAKIGSGWARVEPLYFTEGKTNNVLVISNSTYECGSYFMKAYVTTVEGPQRDGVPFTNCPNCRIEFRGTTPKFKVTCSRASEENGFAWYGMALGEMIDHEQNSFTTKHYLLKDPVRVRYVLPTEGYAEAPLQCLSNTLVLGGNAEFEFDVSEFVWPKATKQIPIVYNDNGYAGWNHRKYYNVEQLNLTNADRLPVSPTGAKARLKMADDGKTLNLVVPGCGGTLLLFR